MKEGFERIRQLDNQFMNNEGTDGELELEDAVRVWTEMAGLIEGCKAYLEQKKLDVVELPKA